MNDEELLQYLQNPNVPLEAKQKVLGSLQSAQAQPQKVNWPQTIGALLADAGVGAAGIWGIKKVKPRLFKDGWLGEKWGEAAQDVLGGVVGGGAAGLGAAALVNHLQNQKYKDPLGDQNA